MGKFVHLINWGFDLQVISVVKTIKKKKKKNIKKLPSYKTLSIN